MKTYPVKNDNQEGCLTRTCGKIQEEEFCRILDMRKNLQFCEILIKHLNHYLSLGWHLAAVNFQSRVHHMINFQEPQEAWSEKLLEIGLDGAEINVGVRTGSDSGLLILEVPKQGRGLPFRREDWSSQCVAEVGAHLEHHYYKLPDGWRLPSAFVLRPFEVKVFGEGNLILAPPSLDPRTQDKWRWLRSPWDHALSQPSPILKRIIERAAPEPESCLAAPAIPAWETIYPAIASHPRVLQALMSPAPDPESYYQCLLATALADGLRAPQLLLGLLWHAPWGDARERPQRLQYLQRLLSREGLAAERCGESPCDDRRGQYAVSGAQLQTDESRRITDPHHDSSQLGDDYGYEVAGGNAEPAPEWRAERPGADRQKSGRHWQGDGEFDANWQEWLRASQESFIIERHRYEAMIYELGKLQAWQEIGQQERRENKRINRKIEAQLAKELEYLRNLFRKNS